MHPKPVAGLLSGRSLGDMEVGVGREGAGEVKVGVDLGGWGDNDRG